MKQDWQGRMIQVATKVGDQAPMAAGRWGNHGFPHPH